MSRLEQGKKIRTGAGGRGPRSRAIEQPDVFDACVQPKAHAAFGGGLPFLRRPRRWHGWKLQIALRALFDHAARTLQTCRKQPRPFFFLGGPPQTKTPYHFHKLERLMVTV